MPYKLKSPFDFSFISKYGKVFKVFDDQDGGNVCFGTEKNGKRYFVKFAGAPQARYDGKIEDAIARLKASVKVYQDIGKHPSLIRFISTEEIGGGFAVIFEWTDAKRRCPLTFLSASYCYRRVQRRATAQAGRKFR